VLEFIDLLVHEGSAIELDGCRLCLALNGRWGERDRLRAESLASLERERGRPTCHRVNALGAIALECAFHR
jgi:hypothetical protein